MTIAAVALSLVGFLLLRTLGATWRNQVDQTPNDRVVTRNKLGWDHYLPAHYGETIRRMDGIADAVSLRWAQLRLPSKRELWFESNAVGARSFVDMHYELECPREQQEAFVQDRRGGYVSAQLAKELGWKLGDRVAFLGRYDQPVELVIRGIFRSKREGFAHRVLYMHLEYLNETLPVAQRDLVSIVAARVTHPEQSARIARSIDGRFDEHDMRTFTMEDKALNAAITGRFSAILKALNVVSLLTLGVVLLILLNTMVMSARERTQEFATLRALGFGKRHVALLLIAEASALAFASSCLALLLAFPVVERGVSHFAQETMALPPLRIHANDAATLLCIGALIALLAAYIPVRRTFALRLTDALRYLG